MTKRGRAPKSNNLSVRRTVRLDDADNQKINEYCEKTGKTISDVFRDGVMRYIDCVNNR